MNIQNYRTNSSFKKNKRSFGFWLFSAGLFIIGALLIGALYLIFRSSWFRVKEISAPDLPGISHSEILDALKTQMLAGKMRAMLGPNNILFWEFGNYPNSLFRFPALKDIRVASDFWGRSVKITAGERELWGALCYSSESKCYGVDENGTVFSDIPSVSGSLILKINDTNNRFLILGQPVFSRPEWFDAFKSSIDTLNKNGFRVVSAEIEDLSLREWTAKIANGPEFHFSLTFAPENFDAILKNLGTKMDLSKVTYVDFRVPDRIYYK